MLELYIIAFLILFTNLKHKNMSLTSFVCSLSNHKVKSFKEILCAGIWPSEDDSKHGNGSQSSHPSNMPP